MGIQPIRKYVGPEIPDKLYFRIGDVARLCEVPAYVLRFWETEFPQLKPNKGGTGQRLYRKRDVEMALRIKSLLYDQGYTIPGARQVFKSEVRAREIAHENTKSPVVSMVPEAVELPQVAVRVADPDRSGELRRKAALRAIADELRSLVAILQQPPKSSTEADTRPTPKLHAFRPRLVLEPKPLTPLPDGLRLVSDPRSQGDLFPGA